MQSRHAMAANVHLAQEQIREHADQREDTNDHYPGDSGRGVAMRSKQDSADHDELQKGHETNANQRVTERIDHGFPYSVACKLRVESQRGVANLPDPLVH